MKFLKLGIISISVITSVYSMQEQSWAHAVYNKMTLPQKIGQVLMAAVPTDPSNQNNPTRLAQLNLPTYLNQEYIEKMIQQYHIGGLLYIGEGNIAANVKATNHCQRLSSIPLLPAADYEPGMIRLLDAIKYPRNMTLGAISNLELIEQLGELLGIQAKRTGIHVVFAPDSDVNNNEKNPVINDRSCGEDPAEVSKCVVAFMKGLQKVGVIACGKHFPGHGDTDTDSHFGLPRIPHNRERLERIELVPFKELIRNKIASMMIAHLMVPALDEELPTSLSSKAVQLLKELGHDKLIFIDGMIMKALTEYYQDGEAELKALQAGVHMLVFPADVPQAFNRIKDAINKGELSEQKLDAAVLKILMAKEALGLHKQENVFVPEDGVEAVVNSEKAYALKREIYRNAVTLVKNGEMIPVREQSSTIFLQVGGDQESVIKNAFIRKGIITLYISSQPTEEEIRKTLLILLSYQRIVIGLFDMNKFANQSFGIHPKIRELIDIQNARVIVTLFGSPYALKFFEHAAAIVQAYEPDPDAQQAAADVLFGDLVAQGTLPVTACEQFKARHSVF